MNLSVSYNWLKEYLETKKTAKEFAKELSLFGPSVDSIKNMGQGLEKVVVGKIVEIKKHPDADKLNVAQVDIGRKKSIQLIFGQVVVLKKGNLLPVGIAPIKLPTGISVKKAKIRGVESAGMFCLDSELGLSGQDRCTFFDRSVKPGTSLIKAMGLNDEIMDVEVTSNRPDSMSIIGLAREAAAITGEKYLYEQPSPNLEIKKEELPLKVRVNQKELCPRYQAIAMTNVKVKPSPIWLQKRLISAGLRPINNLVDITNYVLLEYGQPLHVFDYKKLQGNLIIVRKAKKGERILALDGKRYNLTPDNLVITDAEKPVAIAGVMGGEKSAAGEKTKTIVFESATFEAYSIRKTSRALNLYTDASNLFEKNLNTNSTQPAILRAVELAKEITGAKVASKLLDIRAKEFKATVIEFDPALAEEILGLKIKEERISEILESIGFEVKQDKLWQVTVPWWRTEDVEYDYDLIEEIGRLYGYHKLPTKLPEGQIPVREKNKEFFWEDLAKDVLAGVGFSEIYTYSFISKKLIKDSGFDPIESIELFNPLNEDLQYMRPTLIAGVLQAVEENQTNFDNFKIFELSNVYLNHGENKLPDERLTLTGAVVSEQKDLFYQVKGAVEQLVQKMGIYEVKFKSYSGSLWQTDQTSEILVGNVSIGKLGRVKIETLQKFGIKKSVALFNLDFQKMVTLASSKKVYQEIPAFPEVTRDLAIVIEKEVAWQGIKDLVTKFSLLIKSVNYLSVYTDSKIGRERKSLAFRMVFCSENKTLESEEVDKEVEKIVKKLQDKFGAKLR